ncbi:MAG: hypothetical protein R3F49_18835, partial [Planctomycetota bacterium]
GKVVVESSGSEVRVTHISGGEGALVAELASEPGFDVGGRYLDWEPQRPATPEEAVPTRATIVLDPSDGAEGDPEHVYWGRFVERRENRPAIPPRGTQPAQLELGGLALALAPGDPRSGIATTLARELSELLGVTVRVIEHHPTTPSTDGTARVSDPIVVHIQPGDEGARTLAALLSAVEAHTVRP